MYSDTLRARVVVFVCITLFVFSYAYALGRAVTADELVLQVDDTTLLMPLITTQGFSSVEDPARHHFEHGVIDGWQSDGNHGGSLVSSSKQAYLGDGSLCLRTDFPGGEERSATAYLAEQPLNPRGTITAGVYVPESAPAGMRSALFLLSDDWSWHDSEYVTLRPGRWTLLSWAVNDITTLQGVNELGVLIASAQAYEGCIYIDSFDYTEATDTAVAGPSLIIDAAENNHPINPHIYGLNFPKEALGVELDLPLARWGGNGTSRYNYLVDATNQSYDWYFINRPTPNDNPDALPFGSSADRFVAENNARGWDTVLTAPMLGWVAKDRELRCGFSVAKYGPQDSVAPDVPDCGRGLRNGFFIKNVDPTDTSMPVDETFVQDWIAHLQGQFGTAGNGGVEYFNFDNEPMLWQHTHHDVHPGPTSYDELRDLTYAYGGAIKAADPGIKTLGHGAWGWGGYFWSGADGAWWTDDTPDRHAHGDKPFTPWYLEQMALYEEEHGQRILDYLDLHLYPKHYGVAVSRAGNASVRAVRLRSTRELWDRSYVAESWIGEPVYLLPRMHRWVAEEYPGTKLAISEYNWGGLEDINGALAQADVLGIFARERLDMAALWDPPAVDDPGAYALRMFRNYDGEGSKFGDTYVRSTSINQSTVSVYGALREDDGAMTVMVINKMPRGRISELTLNNYTADSTVEMYQYSVGDLTQIVSDTVVLTDTTLLHTFPAQSITLFVFAPGAEPGDAVLTSTPGATTPLPATTETPIATGRVTATVPVTTTRTLEKLNPVVIPVTLRR